MFTGIIEALGTVRAVEKEGSNLQLTIAAHMAAELKVDQSVAHNGVCLTVVAIHDGSYRVTAIAETLERTNLGQLVIGEPVNLERCLRMGDRLDGHWVQGHVDTVTTCVSVTEHAGSWTYRFKLPERLELLVEKGSICINGTSLTIADLDAESFSVAIIPYTHAHTTFHRLRTGDQVNIEYDVLGKYVLRMAEVGR